MLKRFFERFKKEPEMPESTDIELSKIDKHMNFILRDRLGYINRNITARIVEINQHKEAIIHELRGLHKATLMNTKIPEREIQIMDGNRENYIKRISHFLANIDVPKNYLDTYDYCVRFSQNLEALNREVQKNIFVLQHFFENEVRAINKSLHGLEEIIIDIRALLEKNGVEVLKEIQEEIKAFTENIVKERDFQGQIAEEEANVGLHQDKLGKLNERIKTIITGTDYRALEAFNKEKDDAEQEIKNILKAEYEIFSSLDTGLKKFYYLNPDRKIIREYMEDYRKGITADRNLEIAEILQSLKTGIENNLIDLKDRKKEQCIESINRLNLEHLKDMQSQVLKLEDIKHRAQTKITHNSASLNLSEQQYWINATEDKMKYHQTNIDKLQKNIGIVKMENEDILAKIQKALEKIMQKSITVKDDITEGIMKEGTMPDIASQ
jgi:hypothetical protein